MANKFPYPTYLTHGQYDVVKYLRKYFGISRNQLIKAWHPLDGANFPTQSALIEAVSNQPSSISRQTVYALLQGRTWHEWANRKWWKAASTADKLRIGRAVSLKIFTRGR